MSDVEHEPRRRLDDYVSLDGIDIIDLNPTLGLFPPRGPRGGGVSRARRRAPSPEGLPQGRQSSALALSRPSTDTAYRWRRGRGVANPAAVRSGELRSPEEPERTDRCAWLRSDERQSACGASSWRSGPAFRSGATVPPFENVHIYDALSEVLGVTPAANDGDPKVARSLLR